MTRIVSASPCPPTVTEPQVRAHRARTRKALQRLDELLADQGAAIITDRDEREAAEAAAKARAKLAESIAASMPLLTAEQREQLRPILAGTLPAPRADESAPGSDGAAA